MATPTWFLRQWGYAAEIAGTVYRDARPAPDVMVTLRSTLTQSGLVPERAVLSDNQGHFTFGVLPPAGYSVSATAPDRATARIDVDLGLLAADPPSDRLELHLGVCEAIVHGIVRDASGGAIAGASVATTRLGQYPGRDAETGADGEYRLCVARGLNAIAVSASGYGVVEKVVVVGGTRRVDIAMSPAATIEGVVLDAAGAPVAQASIRVSGRSEQLERTGSTSAVADAQGHFQLEAAPGAGDLVAFSGDGWSPHVALDLKPGEIVRGLVLRIDPGAPIRGRVLMSGVPVAEVELHFWSENGSAGAMSGSDGTFALSSGPTGTVRVWARGHRVISASEFVVPATGADHLDIDVAPLARVSGHITKSDSPVAGARVTLRAPGHVFSAVSDLRGGFHVDGLSAGSYDLDVDEDGGRARSDSQLVDLGDGEDKDLGVIELAVAGRVAGRVVDTQGQPVTDAFVKAESGSGAATDETGAFVLEGLALGQQHLTVYLGGVALVPIGAPASVELSPRDSSVSDVLLRVRVQSSTISGRVIDATGRPLPDVELQVRSSDDPSGWGFASTRAVTAQDGRFAIDNLVRGVYAVRALQRGGGEVIVSGVEAPHDGLEVVLAADGRLEGRLDGFAGPVDVTVYTPDQRARRARVDGDRFSLANLAAGDYFVVAHADQVIATASAHVSPPTTTSLVIRARSSRKLVGVVRDLATGMPLAGRYCAAGPTGSGTAPLWYALTPTASDGRFEITVGADELEVTCAGDAAFVEAARVGSSELTLWTVHRSSVEVRPLGVSLADRFAPRIDQVAPGSMAEHAGLRAGDLIVAIGERPVDGAGTAAVIEYLHQRAGAGAVAMTVLRGGQRITVVADG